MVLQEWSLVREDLNTDRGIPFQNMYLIYANTFAEDQVTHAIRVLRILESVADILPASTSTAVAGMEWEDGRVRRYISTLI